MYENKWVMQNKIFPFKASFSRKFYSSILLGNIIIVYSRGWASLL